MLSRLAHRVAHRWIFSTLRPTVVPTDHFEIMGEQVPTMFHAGKSLFKDIRDGFVEGRYGYGFYAAFDAEFVRRWYGPVVTQFRAKPRARVLVGSVMPSIAPTGLAEAVFANDLEFLFKGDDSKMEEHRSITLENPLHWVAAQDRLAIEVGYDIVIYCDEQIVVKLPGTSVIIEGEA